MNVATESRVETTGEENVRPDPSRAHIEQVRVEHDAATGADFHYRGRDYLGFTATVGDERGVQHAAVRFDRGRGSHIHLGFFDTDTEASRALTTET